MYCEFTFHRQYLTNNTNNKIQFDQNFISKKNIIPKRADLQNHTLNYLDFDELFPQKNITSFDYYRKLHIYVLSSTELRFSIRATYSWLS